VNIWVELKGKPSGPYGVEQVQSMLQGGTLELTDRASIAGSEEWRPLADLCPQFAPYPQASGWMYAVGDRHVGPVSAMELVRLFWEERISDDTSVLAPGGADWATLQASGLLKKARGDMPPLTLRQKRRSSFFLAPFFGMFDFRGRATRWELVNSFILAAIGFLPFAIIRPEGRSFEREALSSHDLFVSLLLLPLALTVSIMWLSVAVRRLHDVGLSGWFVIVFGLMNVVPVIGPLIALAAYFLVGGQPGTNRFGPNPRRIYSRVRAGLVSQR
jgi:uncharacterized membrane protein YhaH (DUF805 family)